MEDKEFDQLTPEEKKARFQKAVDDYNSGFVEVDYTFRSVDQYVLKKLWKMPEWCRRSSSRHRSR